MIVLCIKNMINISGRGNFKFLVKVFKGEFDETAHVLNNSGHQLFTIDRKSRKFDYDKTTKICYKNVGFIMFICYIILLVFDLFV